MQQAQPGGLGRRGLDNVRNRQRKSHEEVIKQKKDREKECIK